VLGSVALKNELSIEELVSMKNGISTSEVAQVRALYHYSTK